MIGKFQIRKLTTIFKFKKNFNWTKVGFEEYRKEDCEKIFREFPYAKIKRKIKFNAFGLYLIAESNKPIYNHFILDTKDLGFIILLPIALFRVQGMIVSYILWYLLRTIDYFQIMKKNSFIIKKIFLHKSLKKLVIQNAKGKYSYVDIKNVCKLNSNNSIPNMINNSDSAYFAPININNETHFIPLNINIIDKEVFSAVCKGLYVKLEDEEQSQYKKLNTDDFKNYYI